jgi:NAD(P)-dependent dehydrogenase (short-subunit alcohol dehydrogenase family)
VTNASRIAWVVGVGASRGLGAAAARRFAREGFKVAVTGRSPDALQVIADEIVAAGGQAIPAVGDAQQEARIVDILDRLESIGPVEVGVYNAGNAIWGPPLETKTADFETI